MYRGLSGRCECSSGVVGVSPSAGGGVSTGLDSSIMTPSGFPLRTRSRNHSMGSRWLRPGSTSSKCRCGLVLKLRSGSGFLWSGSFSFDVDNCWVISWGPVVEDARRQPDGVFVPLQDGIWQSGDVLDEVLLQVLLQSRRPDVLGERVDLHGTFRAAGLFGNSV